MTVWYDPQNDEIHVILTVNKWLRATLMEGPKCPAHWVELTWPRWKKHLVYIGKFGEV